MKSLSCKRFLMLLLAVLIIVARGLALAEESISISFDAETYSIPIGKAVQLKPIISVKKNIKIGWSSSNEEVATVNANGTVKAVSVGKATITATWMDDETVSASCEVSVVLPVKKIAFTEKNVSLAVKTSIAIKPQVLPEDATNPAVAWSSSNEKVAIVDDNGVISGVSKGNANIIATALDGSNVKASISVKVDNYDLVFTNNAPQTARYYYGNGHFTVKGKTKNNCVDLVINTMEMSVMMVGGPMSESFRVIPRKNGTDTITVKAGKKQTKLSVYVNFEAYMSDAIFVEPEGKGYFDDHTYRIIHESCSWKEAKEKCEEMGGHLVTITTEREQRFIEELNRNGEKLWIGIHKNNYGNWEWVNQENSDYDNWAPNPPEQYTGKDSCAVLYYWFEYDSNSNDVAGFICEWDSVMED